MPLPTAKTILARALNSVPFPLQRHAVETTLNVLLRDACHQGDLDFLEGHCVAISILDLSLQLSLGFDNTRLYVLPPNTPKDVRISGNTKSFLMMAIGREDPDTLFFQRRLNIEGDTELGLAVKNTLDSIGPLNLPAPLQQLIR